MTGTSSSGVSAKTAAALEQAMQRLLDGAPVRTDGTLPVANLAREAGVSRATANRATLVLTRFRTHLAGLAQDESAAVPDALRERVRRLEAEIAAAKRAENQEIADLRQRVRVLAQHVQALALDNDALRRALAEQGQLRVLPGHGSTATDFVGASCDTQPER